MKVFGVTTFGAMILLTGAASAQECDNPIYRAGYDPSTNRASLYERCDPPPGQIDPILVPIIAPDAGTQALWASNPTNHARPEINLTDAANGFDLVFSYDRPTEADPAGLGNIVIDGIRLGNDVDLVDLRVKAIDDAAFGAPNDGQGPNVPFEIPVLTPGKQWPDGMHPNLSYGGSYFSPAIVLQNATHTLGISVHYPVRERKHNMRFFLESTSEDPVLGRSWKLTIRVNSNGAATAAAGNLQVGELGREYVVAVRVQRGDPHLWVQTLEPYRRYFRQLYGWVRYSYDPRPVRGEQFARTYAIRAGEPYGFWNNPGGLDPNYAENMNPYTYGWKPWTENLVLGTTALGYKRTLIWSPAGAFDVTCNFPFIFTSNWANFPDPSDYLQLLQVEQKGVQLGLYWGRAIEPMAQLSCVVPEDCVAEWAAFNGPCPEKLDPNNAQQVEWTLTEFERAMVVNSTLIGLDAFLGGLGLAERLDWLDTLRDYAHYGFGANPKFLIEPARTDVFLPYAPLAQVDRYIRGPLTMADFLVPGHERYSVVQGLVPDQNYSAEEFGDYIVGSDATATTAFRRAQARRAAERGWIPIIMNANNYDNGNNAAPKPPVSIAGDDPSLYVPRRSWQVNPEIPDEPQYRLSGDINLDGVVDVQDFNIVVANMGKTLPAFDLDGDLIITVNELSAVVFNLGNDYRTIP